jgi:hypothetical protein
MTELDNKEYWAIIEVVEEKIRDFDNRLIAVESYYDHKNKALKKILPKLYNIFNKSLKRGN